MIEPSKSEITLYVTEDQQTHAEVRLEGDTVWLTQAQMADLFQTSVPNVNMHLRNIYAERELSEEATIKDFLIVRAEGTRKVQRQVAFCNLEAIIAVATLRLAGTSFTKFIERKPWQT